MMQHEQKQLRENMIHRYQHLQSSPKPIPRHIDDKSDTGLSRDALILKYTPYVKRMVGRIATHLPKGVDRDDLINAGIIGLIEALDRYDASRDNAFITFATFRIRGAVLSELRARMSAPAPPANACGT